MPQAPRGTGTNGAAPQRQYGYGVSPQRAYQNGAAPQRRRAGGTAPRPAYASGAVTAGGAGAARITPSRASRHTRASVATARNQVLQKRLIIAGAYAFAMVICWFYVFPFLENVLPSEF